MLLTHAATEIYVLERKPYHFCGIKPKTNIHTSEFVRRRKSRHMQYMCRRQYMCFCKLNGYCIMYNGQGICAQGRT